LLDLIFLIFSLFFASNCKTQKFGPCIILESQFRALVYSFPPADATAWQTGLALAISHIYPLSDIMNTCLAFPFKMISHDFYRIFYFNSSRFSIQYNYCCSGIQFSSFT